MISKGGVVVSPPWRRRSSPKSGEKEAASRRSSQDHQCAHWMILQLVEQVAFFQSCKQCRMPSFFRNKEPSPCCCSLILVTPWAGGRGCSAVSGPPVWGHSNLHEAGLSWPKVSTARAVVHRSRYRSPISSNYHKQTKNAAAYRQKPDGAQDPEPAAGPKGPTNGPKPGRRPIWIGGVSYFLPSSDSAVT